MSHAHAPSLSFVERVADSAAKNSSGKQAMILNHIAVGCMVAMALPAVFKALHGIWGGSHGDEMTHTQRLNIERVVRDLDRRSMWPGDRRGPERDGGHPDPQPRRF